MQYIESIEGSDGMKVWDLRTNRLVETPQWSATRGASTVLIWIKPEDTANDVVISGTQNGRLVCWECTEERARFFPSFFLCTTLISK